MLEKGVGFFSISAEIEYNLLHEFETHKIEENCLNKNIVIVVDGSYSGIDKINMEAAMETFSKNNPNYSRFLEGIFLKRGEEYFYFKNNG